MSILSCFLCFDRQILLDSVHFDRHIFCKTCLENNFGHAWYNFSHVLFLIYYCLSSSFVRYGISEIGSTKKKQIELKEKRSIHTHNQLLVQNLESGDKGSTSSTQQKGANLHCFNSLYNPKLAVHDLDTIEINQKNLNFEVR